MTPDRQLCMAAAQYPAGCNSVDRTSHGIERQSPRHQYQLRSNLDISRKLQFDAAAYYTGALPNPQAPAYTRLDARLGYRPRDNFEVSLSGQNLQGGRHAEFISATRRIWWWASGTAGACPSSARSPTR